MDIIQTMTDEEKQTNLLDNMVMREREIHSYQVNIDNYQAILQTLPSGEWPDEILQFKGLNQNEIAENVPLDKIEIVADYSFRDRLLKMLKMEIMEQSKAKHVYTALKVNTKIDAAELPSLLTVASDRAKGVVALEKETV